MQNLTYGRKKPEAGDDSLGTNGWFKALADNAAKDDAHDHDGVNSKRLTSLAMDAYTTTTGTGWVSQGNGLYRLEMTMPTGRIFDSYQVSFRTAAGQQVMLDVQKTSSTTFYVFTNDNTQNYTVLLTS